MAGRIVNYQSEYSRLIPMSQMKALQIARVVGGEYDGNIVMRTASVTQDEVLNLTGMKISNCWTSFGERTPMVELLPKGEKIILELYND